MRRVFPVVAVLTGLVWSTAAGAVGFPSAGDGSGKGGGREAGPIAGLVVTGGVDASGNPTDAPYTFSPQQPSITVLAQVGQTEGGTVTFTWYAVEGKQENRLFSEEVDVATFDRAFSVGTNPGTLAPGLYKVKARLGDGSQSALFEVDAPEDGTEGTAQTAQGAPPAAGGTGTVPKPPGSTPDQYPWDRPATGDSELDALFFDAFFYNDGGVDRDSDQLGVFFTGSTEVHEEGRYSVEATFTIGDASSSRRFSPVPVLKRVRPCDIRGGSDLPDTVATVRGVLSRDGSRLGETSPHRITLGPDQARPDVTINSSPPPGSKVERGDTIRFARGDVLAREIRRGATWQTGVQSLQLVAPDGLVTNAQADSNRSLPCDEKQWSLGTPQAQYEVPGDAKGEIKICAMAVDFAGNENNDTCASYYVGEVWEGTFERRTGGGPSGCTFSVSGTLQVVVASDGAVSGGGPFSAPPPVCPEGVGMGGSGSLTVTGTRENGTFHLTLTSEAAPGAAEFDLAVRGTRAESEVESTLPDGSTDLATVALECKTCEEEAVG